MNLKTIGKLFGIGVALAILTLAAGNEGQIGLAQSCTVTLTPGQSIQQAINNASLGSVICLTAGVWKENIIIPKDLTLRGAGVGNTSIIAVEGGKPVILLRSSGGVLPHEVTVEKLEIRGAGWVSGTQKCYSEYLCPDGISIKTGFTVYLLNNAIRNNADDGVQVEGSSYVWLEGNDIIGNRYDGIFAIEMALVRVGKNNIKNNGHSGIHVLDSVNLIAGYNTISANGTGIRVSGRAQASIHDNTIENNLNGIRLREYSKASVIDNTITGNTDCGIIAWYPENFIACANNTVSGNGKDYCGAAKEVCK